MHSILHKWTLWLLLSWLASCHPSTTLHLAQPRSDTSKQSDQSQASNPFTSHVSLRPSPHTLLVLNPESKEPSSPSQFQRKLMDLIYRLANVLIIHRRPSASKTTADSPLHDPDFLKDTKNYLSEDMYQYAYSTRSRPILRSFKIDKLRNRLKRFELRRKETLQKLELEKKKQWMEEAQEHSLKSMSDWIRRHRKIGMHSQGDIHMSRQSSQR
jgi:hypothetical protein